MIGEEFEVRTDPENFHLLRPLGHYARTDPERIALRCNTTQITFAELDIRSERVARALQHSGVSRGERIAYLGRNWPEFFEVLFGCAKIGAVLAPLNWRLTADDLAELISDAQARIVVADEEFSASAPRDVMRLTIGSTYERWRDESVGAGLLIVPEADEPFVQFYTSGTTGLPKAVVITSRNLAFLVQAAPRWRIEPDSVLSVVMPLFHMGGSAWALVGLFRGACCVLATEFEPAALLRQFAQWDVTNVLVAPAMLQSMVDALGDGTVDLTPLRSILYGAAPISLPLLRIVRERFKAPLIQVFGLTETCGAVVQLDPGDHRDGLLASVGRPYPWVELEIRDPHTEQSLPVNEDGEIWVRSGQCSQGYWRRPNETAQLRTADGWSRTGDIGRFDNDGYLFVTGRLTDLIITGGENVYPAEVERVLYGHPFIDEVAVVGIPDRAWGEAVVAVVVPRRGSGISDEALSAWARPRIAGFRRPRAFRFVDSLPRNPTGKVLKRELQRLFDSGAVADASTSETDEISR